MSQDNNHIAQLNFGSLTHGFDDPRSAGFVDNIARVNGLAERSEGFVWRDKEMSDDEVLRVFGGDPNVVATLSVWRDLAALEHFVQKTLHGRFLNQRQNWFTPGRSGFVMWYVAPGHRPTLAEAADRHRHLQAKGDSDHAFGWTWARQNDTVAEAETWT